MSLRDTIKVMSLFSGSGGLDLGFLEVGGFDIILANDINKYACKTYNANIGNHCLCEDVRVLKDLPLVDLVIGGPPCQGFSTANPQRAFDDERNWLFKEYKRILVETNPKMFLMENVSGMMTLSGGMVYDIIKKELSEAGYKIYSRILNAVDYGVPQSRNRVVIIGVRKDLNKDYSFPAPIVNPPIFGKYQTVGDAFSKPFKEGDPNHIASSLTVLNIERIKYIPQGGSMADCPPHLQNNSDKKRAMRRLHLMRPSYTIVHNNCDHYYHPTENRRITIREMARLQGYPDDYVFYGSKSEQSKQVANSVPVQLSVHLALSIKKYFENE